MSWSLIGEFIISYATATAWASLPIFVLAAATAMCAACIWFIMRRVYRRRFETQRIELEFQDLALEKHCILSITDTEARFIRVNDKFLSTFGYLQEDIIGRRSDLLNFSDETQSLKQMPGPLGAVPSATTPSMHAGDHWTGEQVLRRSDGSRILALTTIIPRFDRKGAYLGNICLHTDITQQKISDEKRQLCQVLDDLQDEVFIFEVESLQIHYMNKAALHRFGWSLDELSEKQISATDKNFDIRLFRSHTAPLLTGEREVVSIEVQHKSSTIEISTRLHRNASGQRFFLSVLRDISARKKIEAAKMETVAQVSHELRSPLTSIKGALGLILSGKFGDLSPGLKNLIDIANRNGEHLLSVVDDILDLERMNAGKMTLHLEETNMSELVEDIRTLNSTLGQENGISIAFKRTEERFPVRCDRKRISQVITNLLSNAIKYSPENGVVEVGLESDQGNVRVSIKDSGPGIPASELPKLFQNFSRVTSGDGMVRKGTGLGLAISKKIIALHRGKIDIHSIEGEGTEVFFDLPRSDQARDPVVVQLSNSVSSETGSAPESHASLGGDKMEATACQT